VANYPQNGQIHLFPTLANPAKRSANSADRPGHRDGGPPCRQRAVLPRFPAGRMLAASRPARGRRCRPGRLPHLRSACRAAARATARGDGQYSRTGTPRRQPACPPRTTGAVPTRYPQRPTTPRRECRSAPGDGGCRCCGPSRAPAPAVAAKHAGVPGCCPSGRRGPAVADVVRLLPARTGRRAPADSALGPLGTTVAPRARARPLSAHPRQTPDQHRH
jgi:hypothetical protein